MDNRRFSARADMGAPISARRDVVTIPVLDRAIDVTRVNWEVLLFAGIMLLAIITRMWDLGSRAFHHDESIHAYFSNYFLRSGSYTTTPGFQGGYDPTYHGPFLYHVTALAFWLFGTTDAIARLMPALFGIVLVGLCWFLRPFIGRTGALLAALLVVLSPSISYYSRSLRHDIFALTGTMMLFVGILWFLRTHQAKWVYLGAAGFAIAFASHELSFIIAFLFVLFLVVAAFLFPSFANASNSSSRTIREGDDVNSVRSALSALGAQRWTLIGAALLFAAIYVVLFTNLLTKPYLVLTGLTNGLTYWLGEHRVARGNQPHFYYLMLMLFYEPLAVFAGLGTIVYMIAKWLRRDGDSAHAGDDVDTSDFVPTDEYGHSLPSIEGLRGLALGFLAFWSFGALIAFSLAGERMPWLNMQTALPFTLLAAAGLGRLIRGIEWGEVWRSGGVYLGIAVILFLISGFALMAHLNGSMPAPQGASADLQKTMRGLLLFVFTAGLFALAGWLAYKMLPSRAIKMVGLTFAVLLTAYAVRSMSLLNYRHGDVPTEMLVYTQSAPDVPIVASMIERLSRDETAFDATRNANDPTGGHGLTISIDQNDAIEWPFDWYFRDMKDLKYFNTSQWEANQANIVAPNAPVILASTATENNTNFQTFIKDKYTTQKYVLNWWFPEDVYRKNGQNDLGTALDWIRSNGVRYMLYRDPGMPLGSRDFFLHVRNDLAVKTGMAGPTGVTAPVVAPGGATPSTDKIYGMFELPAPGADRGQFNLPRGISTGPDGSFYVVDTANMRLQKFDKDGKWIALIGNGKGEGDGQFKGFSDDAVGTGPGGVAVDKAGNVYVADTWNHRIQKFDKDGKFLAKWGEFISLGDPASTGDAAKDSKFFGPRGVAVGPDGNVYVTDTGNKRVQIFDPNGKYLRQISSGMSPTKLSPGYPFTQPGELNEPIGIAVDGSGMVYVADTNNKRIQKFDAQGKFVAQWAVPGNGWDPGSYLEPFLALDGAGNVYATAPTGQKVLKFSPTGQPLGEKNAEGAVTLKTPTGITVGADGTIYVVDTGSNGVIKLGQIK
ncbi:MAG TPA: flippase activity-associated protein Agl23 [Chloroflexia bacterium]|nr:flippase activity-associated protein Agl23 [Chloroflexia bacterium]